MAGNEVRALLFDLGGVVIDIDFNRALQSWRDMSCLSLEELKSAFTFDEAYRQHERGKLSGSQYFEHLRTKLRLREDHERIAAGWNSIFVAEIAATVRMVRAVRTRFPCYVLTNSNPTHQAIWSTRFPALVQSFDRVFVSSEIGYRKPEPEAYDYVARALGTPTGSIMFFDDLKENVVGAAAAGLQAVHVRGPADVRSELQALGCAL